jgi:hypothetical protein
MTRTVSRAVIEPPGGLTATRAGKTQGRPVKLPPLPGLRSGAKACLSAEVERLLRDVVADGFTVYCCGPRAAPFALVASYQWQDYVDLVTIRQFDRLTIARIPAPQGRRIDVFAPEVVVWAHEGTPQWALRALLNLAPPKHPHVPVSTHPAPPSLHIPRAEQRPMTIRLPPPGRAGMRAARLATVLAAAG